MDENVYSLIRQITMILFTLALWVVVLLVHLYG